MEKHKLTRRGFLRLAAMSAAGTAIVACQPQTVVVKETVEVEKEVTKIVEKEKEVTKIVEKEKEVTKVVEKEKVVTPTPGTEARQAPMLKAKVETGELPPLEERLPVEPWVMEVFDEIGQYGGLWRRGFLGPADVGCNVGRVNGVMPTRWTNDGLGVTPYVCKGWEVSDDNKTWTFYLRPGMKWSDGEPFTADDWVYEYEDYRMDPDIKPGKPPWFRGPGPTPAVIEKVDDYTVKFTYPQPFTVLPEMFAGLGCLSTSLPYSPAHYFKQFHKKYVGAKAEEQAAAAGFEQWPQYFNDRRGYQNNIERPSLRPWLLLNTRGDTTIRTTRNPYYCVVDPEGNQLPYIDEQRFDLVSDPDVLVLKAVQGEVDFQARHIQLPNYSVLKENEDKGGYRVQLIPGFGGNDAMLNVNQTFQGPEGDLLRNRDFRIALSHAIDRDFINQVSFLGIGIPSNYLPPPDSPQHPGPEWELKHCEYDPDLSNQMLDEIIPNRDDEGFRTLPDGSRLELVISCTPAFGPWPDIAEQVAQKWSEVGVRVRADVMERSLLSNRLNANETHFYLWGPGRAVNVFVQSPWIDCNTSCPWGPGYQTWYATDGESGIEPPDDVKHLTDLVNQGRALSPDEAAPLAQEIYRWIIDQQVIIGTCRRSPMVMGVTVVSQKLGNVPESWANDTMFNTPFTAMIEQFYYKR